MDDELRWDDDTARWYAEAYGEWPTNRFVVERAGLAATDTVLNIGCGTGCALRHAAGIVTEGELFGAEPTPAMAAIARAECEASPYGARIRVIQRPAARLPLGDGVVDVALTVNAIQHWAEVDAGLAEARRVLKAGGRLLVAEEDVEGAGHHPDPAPFVERLQAAGFLDVTTTRHAFDGPEGLIRLIVVTGVSL